MSLVAERALPRTKGGRTVRRIKGDSVSVSLVDLDVKAAFLPELVERANNAQTFFKFQVDYYPVPSTYVLKTVKPLLDETGDKVDDDQAFLDRMSDLLEELPTSLHVDRVCCLTRYFLAFSRDDMIYYNYFASPLDSNKNVMVVSTQDLRAMSRKAGTEFESALLRLCVGQLAVSLEEDLGYHDETVGCLFDFCENRDDLQVMLGKQRFDHRSCRKEIHNQALLKAIDDIFRITAPSHSKRQARS